MDVGQSAISLQDIDIILYPDPICKIGGLCPATDSLPGQNKYVTINQHFAGGEMARIRWKCTGVIHAVG